MRFGAYSELLLLLFCRSGYISDVDEKNSESVLKEVDSSLDSDNCVLLISKVLDELSAPPTFRRRRRGIGLRPGTVSFEISEESISRISAMATD